MLGGNQIKLTTIRNAIKTQLNVTAKERDMSGTFLNLKYSGIVVMAQEY